MEVTAEITMGLGDGSIWGTSLVVQWIRICLPVQGTWVQYLMQADSTCRGQLSLSAKTTEAHVPTARAQQQEESLQ